MLKLGYIAANSVYVCTLHTNAVIAPYIEALDKVFQKIAHAVERQALNTLLDGTICESRFTRLN